MARQDIVKKVGPLVGPAASVNGVSPIATYVDLVMDEFSKMVGSREVELTITGDGTDEYSLGSDWVDGFSTISRVAFWEANATTDAPVILLPDEYQIEEDLPAAGASQIRLNFSPVAADRVVVTHSAPEIIGESAGTTSVKAPVDTALAYLAGAALLRAAALAVMAHTPQATDDDLLPSSFSSRAGEYRRTADDYDGKADQLLGVDRKGGGGAKGPPVLVARRVRPAGRSMLTHGRNRQPIDYGAGY